MALPAVEDTIAVEVSTVRLSYWSKLFISQIAIIAMVAIGLAGASTWSVFRVKSWLRAGMSIDKFDFDRKVETANEREGIEIQNDIEYNRRSRHFSLVQGSAPPFRMTFNVNGSAVLRWHHKDRNLQERRGVKTLAILPVDNMGADEELNEIHGGRLTISPHTPKRVYLQMLTAFREKPPMQRIAEETDERTNGLASAPMLLQSNRFPTENLS